MLFDPKKLKQQLLQKQKEEEEARNGGKAGPPPLEEATHISDGTHTGSNGKFKRTAYFVLLTC